MKAGVKNNIWIVYIMVYTILFSSLVVNNEGAKIPAGEVLSFTVPIASLLHDGDWEATKEDKEYYGVVFSEWNQFFPSLTDAPYAKRVNSKGEDVSYYFPLYATICTPLVYLFMRLGIPTYLGLYFTNILSMLVLLVYIAWRYKDNLKKQWLLLLTLSINPVVFYFAWPSYETMLYVFLALSAIHWHENEYNRAGLWAALASALNPTCMMWAIWIIFDFFIYYYVSDEKKIMWKQLFSKESYIRVGKLFLCYTIALWQFVYAYMEVHKFYMLLPDKPENAAVDNSLFGAGIKPILERAVGYYLDWNFGYLPYYLFFFLFVILTIILAINNKKYRLLGVLVAFNGNILLYSVMKHINCGMSGVARYNMWNMSILIVPTVLFACQYAEKLLIKFCAYLFLSVEIIYMVMIIISFGPVRADKTWYCQLTPIAKWGLDYCPQLCWTLPTTFNSRVNEIDGGYVLNGPIVYSDKAGAVRKLYVSREDIDLLNEMKGNKEDTEWFIRKCEKLTDECSFISVPKSKNIYRCGNLAINETIDLTDDSSEKYIINGLERVETVGRWTKSQEVVLSFSTDEDIDNALLHFGVVQMIDGKQHVIITVNEKTCFDNEVEASDEIVAICDTRLSKSQQNIIKMYLPDAHRSETDARELAVMLNYITMTEIPLVESTGTTVHFESNDNNTSRYVLDGISVCEGEFTWTDGDVVHIVAQAGCDMKGIGGNINVVGTMGEQTVSVEINKVSVVDGLPINGSAFVEYGYTEDISKGDVIDMKILLPNSMYEADTNGRKLGLQIRDILIMPIL